MIYKPAGNRDLTVPDPFTTTYAGNLAYGSKQLVSSPKNGTTEVIYTTVITSSHNTYNRQTSKEIQAAEDGETLVGNSKTETTIDNGKKIETIYIYDVDKYTGSLTDPYVYYKRITEVKPKVIFAKTTYEADNTVEFNKQVIATPSVNGENNVTYVTLQCINVTLDTPAGKLPNGTKIIGEKVTKAAVNGLTKVGNIEAVANGDGSTTYKRYEVDSKTGKTVNPTVIATTGKVTKEVIKAVVNYVADPKVKYGDSEVAVKPKDGLKTITNMDIVKDGELEHHDDKVDIVNPINGETHVGNKKTETDKDGKTTITVYNVDPKTGKLDIKTPNTVRTTQVKTQEIPATITYQADSNLDFNKQEVATPAVNGTMKVTYTTVETPDTKRGNKHSEVTKPVQNGLTKVGNKKTETDKDGKTTITVYNVDPKTGKLINPKVISKTIVEPEFISDVPVAESGIEIGAQADSKTAETTDTKAIDIKSNVDEINATKPTAKTHVSLQTGVDNAGRLATVMASVSALIAAAYAAIRRRKD